MPTFVQWVHLSAAVIGVGGIAFLHFVLLPSSEILSPEQRDLIFKVVLGRFRWVSWSVIALLLLSGLYNVREFYWEMAWGRAWLFLTIKITLALAMFAVSLCLTLPFKALNRFREKRAMWLSIALALGMIVILISAYLRRA